MMRIITGRARGTHLYTLEGDATRPTSERAKEAVFSMLQFELAGRAVLDLFAGSGQMALEAVSRGAERAVLVDASPKAVEIIKKNVQKTHFEAECTVLCADYTDVLRTRRHRNKTCVRLRFLRGIRRRVIRNRRFLPVAYLSIIVCAPAKKLAFLI